VEASVGPWAKVRVRTVEEDHGGGHRLVRVRYDLLPTLFARSWLLLLLLAAALVATSNALPATVLSIVVLGVFGLAWRQAVQYGGSVVGIFDQAAQDLGYWQRPWRSEKQQHQAKALTTMVAEAKQSDRLAKQP
jgi:hypothetical protein